MQRWVIFAPLIKPNLLVLHAFNIIMSPRDPVGCCSIITEIAILATSRQDLLIATVAIETIIMGILRWMVHVGMVHLRCRCCIDGVSATYNVAWVSPRGLHHCSLFKINPLILNYSAVAQSKEVSVLKNQLRSIKRRKTESYKSSQSCQEI